MLTKSTLSAVLALASTALAAPRGNMVARDVGPDLSVPGVVDPANVAKGGAIDLLNSWKAYSAAMATATSGPFATDAPAPPLVTEAPTPAQGDIQARDAPEFWTVTITNKFGHDIQTYHANNPGPTPTPNPGAGVIPNGGVASFKVPLGWGGNVAVVENGGGRTFRGDESLIEASYIDQGVWGGKKFDINISYVNGFSLPITCSCDVGVIAGCNKYLWDLNKCPNDNGVGSCRNPQRGVPDGPAATFFAPCAHASYTYPNDSAANSGNGVCGGSSVTCCVGTSCPKNPRQP